MSDDGNREPPIWPPDLGGRGLPQQAKGPAPDQPPLSVKPDARGGCYDAFMLLLGLILLMPGAVSAYCIFTPGGWYFFGPLLIVGLLVGAIGIFLVVIAWSQK